MSRSSIIPTILMLICTALFLAIPQTSLADTDFQTLTVTDLAPEPAENTAPQIVIEPTGQPAITWIRLNRLDSTASLCIAHPPLWEPRVLLQQPLGLGDPLPTLGVHLPWLVWSTPDGQSLQALNITDDSAFIEANILATDTLALTVDNQGGLYTALQMQNTLLLIDHTKGITTTIPLTTGLSLFGEDMVVGADGAVHLLMSERSPNGQPGPIYLASTARPDTIIRLTNQGRSPQMAIQSRDQVHLAWIEADWLVTARGDHPEQTRRLAVGIDQADSFALGAGPTGAQIAWSQNGTLQYASSVDWTLATDLDTVLPPHSSLSLAIDAKSVIHLAWTRETPEGGQNIVYATSPIIPQVRVRTPIQDAVIDRDTLIRAETNLDNSTLEKMDFYLSEEQTQSSAFPVWQYWGTDTTGADGWGVPLSLSDLGSVGPYRTMVVATLSDGQTVKHTDGPFRAQLPEQDPVWLIPPKEPAHDLAYMTALVNPYPGLNSYMDLYLMPFHCSAFGADADTCPPYPDKSPPTKYIGAFALPQTAQRLLIAQRVLFEAAALPDGQYRALAVSHDMQNDQHMGQDTPPFIIQNTFPPQVSVVASSQDRIMVDQITIEATASDQDGTVRSLDFYIEQAHTLFPDTLQSNFSQRIWLGRDTDGQDGWQITRRIKPTWDGDGWHLVAKATDSSGLSSTALSNDTVHLVAPGEPLLRFSRPDIRRVLHGQESLIIHGYRDISNITKISVYARDQRGNLGDLGAMEQDIRNWALVWDTTVFADGTYTLVAIAVQADGSSLCIQSNAVDIDNVVTSLQWDEHTEQVEGLVPIRLRQGDKAHASTTSITFQLADESQQRFTIGQPEIDSPVWGILWNSHTVLDGTYELIAHATTDTGTYEINRTITVRNRMPEISFGQMPGSIWQGTRDISWVARTTLANPYTVTANYSPDDGLHWLPVADVLCDTTGDPHSLRWDTRAVPDSPRARLRLTVNDEGYRSHVTSDAFTVNNQNEPPRVKILSPSPGAPQSQSLDIRWHAWDADGDPLTIQIEYQLDGDTTWNPVAMNLGNDGAYVWLLDDIEQDRTLSLRISAIDGTNARGIDQVSDIRHLANHPPQVSLIWPNSEVLIDGEAAILWRASDADGDTVEIDLYYSDNAGQAWLPLAERIPNTGYFVWQVSFLPQGKNYRLKIVARDGLFENTDESDRTFSVGQGTRPLPRIELSATDNTVHGTCLIAWSTVNMACSPLTTTLSILPDSGGEWGTLAVLPRGSNYVFDSTQWPDGEYTLRMEQDHEDCSSARSTRPLTISNQGNNPPVVEILSPSGGEIWQGTHQVSWRAWDDDQDTLSATLATSTDGGGTWTNIAQVSGQQSSYLWDTSMTTYASQIMRITVSDGQASAADVSGTLITMGQNDHLPTIDLQSLDEDGYLTERELYWKTQDADGDHVQVTISTSRDHGLSWETLARMDESVKNYALPQSEVPSGTPVRIVASDGVYSTQVSTEYREKLPLPSTLVLRLLDPTRQTTWAGTRTIRWQAENRLGPDPIITIELSADGGCTWFELAQDRDNTGQYDWNTQKHPGGVYRIRITASSGDEQITKTTLPISVNNTGQDTPHVSLIPLNTGRPLSGLDEIVWRTRSINKDLVIDLDYSLDQGRNWMSIAHRIENSGRYTWDTNIIPNASRVWIGISAYSEQLTNQESPNGARYSVATDITNDPISIFNPLVPQICLDIPHEGTVWHGQQVIRWQAQHLMGSTLSVRLETLLVGNLTWQTLASDLPAQGSYTWDTSSIPEESSVLLRAIATDGVQYGLDTICEPIVIRGNWHEIE